ncbi:hypothetical protein EKO29_08625 [Colwellia sp. Arc7-635]|uniref:hypothetical protein n=1 Tax=Colwellia sp. Arc7-635 TaxID=2497879 RepID=UPI000F853FF6|nr:hypothetical protein [Colwellia sp. Arc7-635]AZQ84076.1 hypothetical protein EKO29_08625 [Colwellia sp. Arc7-635]
MQLIKSLFCRHGFDNRQRFTIISVTCFMAFIIFNESLSQFKSSAIVLLLLCSLVCLASTRRRLNDAKLHSNWLVAPAGSFLIVGSVIVLTGSSASYWLLLIPLITVLLLLTYPSSNNKQYIFGYNGPVNLADFQSANKSNSRNNQRVEPTMNGGNNSTTLGNTNSSKLHERNNAISSTTFDENQESINRTKDVELGESIRIALFNYKYFKVSLVAISFLLLLIVFVSVFWAEPQSAEIPTDEFIEVQEPIIEFQNKLTLPDNFSIMTSPENGIILHWQADNDENDEVWSLATAVGNKNCENISFSKGEIIRTYRVNIIDNGYYAHFSPLDTNAIINNIVFKNTFSLCEYSFSLKGSQAALGKSDFYGELIQY